MYRPTFVKSLAMVPVRAPEPIAAIGAYWAGHHEATTEELGAMTLLADSIALALRNVQLYDGTIQARSDGAGRGARFRVSLPLAVGV